MMSFSCCCIFCHPRHDIRLCRLSADGGVAALCPYRQDRCVALYSLCSIGRTLPPATLCADSIALGVLHQSRGTSLGKMSSYSLCFKVFGSAGRSSPNTQLRRLSQGAEALKNIHYEKKPFEGCILGGALSLFERYGYDTALFELSRL